MLCSAFVARHLADAAPAALSRSTGERQAAPRGSCVVGTERHDQDAVLAGRIRSGDREAVGELYDRYAGIAMAVAIRVLRDRGAAEDVVHDAFVAVWQRIDRFDVAHGTLRSWLLTIVRNRAIDRLRRLRPAEDIDELDSRSLLRSTPNPTWDATIASLDRRALAAALGTLPAEQREAVELAYFEGLTYRQVAVRMGIPPGTASGRLRMALAKVRVALSPDRDVVEASAGARIPVSERDAP
jgi:RNA polymerase sigma-70 factor (ECF subfamily)